MLIRFALIMVVVIGSASFSQTARAKSKSPVKVSYIDFTEAESNVRGQLLLDREDIYSPENIAAQELARRAEQSRKSSIPDDALEY